MSTRAVTGWCSAKTRTGVGMVAVGLQLAALFVSCGVICGVAWLNTRDSERASTATGALRTDDYSRLAVLVAMRFWLLMVGGGVLSALHTLRVAR